MKKNFAFFFVFFVAALPAFAVSTCETRVDSHPDATTKQRVAYCLTPEPEVPLPAGPELVYYGVSNTKPAEEPEEESAPREPVHFDKDGVAVNQHFMDTKNFPTFANDTLSEQERAALEKLAKEDAAKAAKMRQTPTQAESTAAPKTASKTVLAPSSVLSEENEAGLLARRQKPKRFMKQSSVSETDPAAVYSINEYGISSSTGAQNPEPAMPQDPTGYAPGASYSADMAGQYPMQPAVPTGTTAGEIQQAYALENNPTVPPNANAGGAAPAGFTNNNLAVNDQSFGYNATDPAMQP